MKQRINYYDAAPDAFKAVLALENYVSAKSGLDSNLLHLIKLRASQINNCAYCIDMHVKEARKDGHSEQWINLISAWRESPIFDNKERALLAWTESVTDLANCAATDDEFETLKKHFTDEEITKLTVAIGTINVWNRLGVGFRMQHPIDIAQEN